MKNKILIVIDMQNDFIDGALANPEAQKIVDKTAKLVANWEGDIIFTRDTHNSVEYPSSLEGRYLPTLHCVENTDGWQINEKIIGAAKKNKKARVAFLNKGQFGAGASLTATISRLSPTCDGIYFCGTCTDICVISNVLPIKASFSETPIYIYEKLCAGLTVEKHKAAIEVMKSCQVEIIK